MSKKQGGSATTKQVAVDTVAKLLRKLGSQHNIGSVYEYTYQGNVVVTIDSTQSGRLLVTVAPSAWASQIAEYMWQYEADTDSTVDPTMADPMTDGWVGVLLTDAPEVDDATEVDSEPADAGEPAEADAPADTEDIQAEDDSDEA